MALKGVAWSRDGKTLATCGVWRTKIDRWDAATGKPLDDERWHDSPVDVLRVLPDGKTAISASRTRELRRWNLSGGEPESLLLPGRHGALHTVAISPDGMLAAVGLRASHSSSSPRARTGNVRSVPIMRALLLLLYLLSAGVAAVSVNDEAYVEQLLRDAGNRAAPVAQKPAVRGKTADVDEAAGLVGQRVVVQTLDRGVYLGTLTAVTRESLTLAITSTSRSVSQTIPRSTVSAITPR